MNVTNTAVVLVDDDNDFLSVDGKLHGAIKQVLDSNRVVENINKLINQWREKHGGTDNTCPDYVLR